MEYLNTIIKTFNEHYISGYSELTMKKLNKSDLYPSSEGIQFESNDFSGEIFYYSNGDMEYCEMEFLIYFGDIYKAKVIEDIYSTVLNEEIDKFLTERMSELKTLPNNA